MEAHWTWQGTEVEGEKSMKGKTQEVKSSSKETPPTLGKKLEMQRERGNFQKAG